MVVMFVVIGAVTLVLNLGGSPAHAAGFAGSSWPHPAPPFASFNHAHDDITPGVYPIGASAFQGNGVELTGRGANLYSIIGDGAMGYAPFTLPFRCTIVGMEAEVRNVDASSKVVVELHDAECLNAECDTFVPIVSFDTSGVAPTSDHVIIGTPPLSIEYDPTDLFRFPLWVTVHLNDYFTTRQKLYWVKIYYTVP